MTISLYSFNFHHLVGVYTQVKLSLAEIKGKQTLTENQHLLPSTNEEEEFGQQKTPRSIRNRASYLQSNLRLEAERQGDAMILAEEILCLGDISIVK